MSRARELDLRWNAEAHSFVHVSACDIFFSGVEQCSAFSHGSEEGRKLVELMQRYIGVPAGSRKTQLEITALVRVIFVSEVMVSVSLVIPCVAAAPCSACKVLEEAYDQPPTENRTKA